MTGQLFLIQGSLTQLQAHAIAFSCSNSCSPSGTLYPAFQAEVPGFAEWYATLFRRILPFYDVGTTFWYPTPTDGLPHGVVAVVSTGGPATEIDKAALAVRSALESAIAHLREQLGPDERLLIALPTFRVGMGGDRQRRLRSARVQITTALDTLAQHDRVDAVFVCYTFTMHRIFLEARRQVMGADVTTGSRSPLLESELRAGESVLFVGAGLSRSAGLPDWGQLVSRLAAELDLGTSTNIDYLDLAQWYRERFGRRRLAEVIQDLFDAPDASALPTVGHYLLLSLPFRHVITTNYDDLIERTLVNLKKYPRPVIHEADVARTGTGHEVFVTKLHGDRAHPEDIVLCRDDYDEFFQRRPALALLLEGLLLNQTFFFVGYSLRDINFRQIFNRIARMLREARRPAFATTFEAPSTSTKYLEEQWRRKQLQLIPFTGATPTDQQLELWRFLDGLVDAVVMERPRLFLAPDVQPTLRMAPLRNVLLEEVGQQVELLAQRDFTSADWPEIEPLVDVVECLSRQGWRPHTHSGWDLCRLWERLASFAPTTAERRRLLILALESAEAFTHVERIRAELEELEGG